MYGRSLPIIVGIFVFIGSFSSTFGRIQTDSASHRTVFIEKSHTRSDSSNLGTANSDDWHLLLDEMAENGIQTDEWNERLSELSENPIPLNTASKEMLESIPFLNPEQVENLSYYLYRYGPMVNLSELMLVEGMDSQTMRWLRPFVQLGTKEETPVDYPPMEKALKYGKQTFRMMLGRTLQEKHGYATTCEPDQKYIGDPLHATFKYGFNYKEMLQWGIVMEKDAGESWWNAHLKTIDYVSFHLVLKDAKRSNMLILGDYSVRLGQGLVCGNAFSLGKTTSGMVPEQIGPVFSRHFSSSESNFFRGAALQVALNPKRGLLKTTFSNFISIRELDASSTNVDSTTIAETGLHRNWYELNGLRTLRQTVVGTHLEFRKSQVSIGCSGMAWKTESNKIVPTDRSTLTNALTNLSGNLALDFRAVWSGILLFGELAGDHRRHTAMIAGCHLKPLPRMNVSLLGRKYASNYSSLSGNAFSEGTSVGNEEGLYLASDFQLAKRVRFSGYVDVFRFPWMGFNAYAPTKGQEFAGEIQTTLDRYAELKVLYKRKSKEKNDTGSNAPFYPIEATTKDLLKIQLSHKIAQWQMKTVLLLNQFKFTQSCSHGYALSQDIGVQPTKGSLMLHGHFVLFNAIDWENRIYLWEKDLPGSFSMPMLYGQGCRWSLYIDGDFKNVNLQCKWAEVVQPGVKTIGSGGEAIQGNRKTEARIQLSWKF